MAEINLSKQTYALLQDPLLGDGNIETKILQLLEGEFRRQLTHDQTLDQALSQKYAMPFADFMERRTSVQHGNNWELETDAAEWEKAVSAITHLQAKLQEIEALTSARQ
ncbi:MAG: hypothetical protein KF832_08915 [Caldilineaceae bacterium]|nr:hypothetical protein [Caldilineaceae bacterium]